MERSSKQDRDKINEAKKIISSQMKFLYFMTSEIKRIEEVLAER